ncbi:MAG: TIGR04053 family radical SAM/SPASM domain-containing protein [Chloroflexi bacterium]|nr:TIGR04053 family radical SAM/SPASM domain-containing protein [Chloroflexota bacterium]
MTKACALACRHCRAVAQPRRSPQELTTEEGLRLLGDIAGMGTPLMVLTGGDPLMRPDLMEFIKYGNDRGMRMSLAPSATRLVTPETMARAKEAGLARASLSLDGSTAEIHDAFRRTPGSYERTIRAIQAVGEAGVSLQINTTVTRYNLDDLKNMMDLVPKFKAVLWDLFFLVPTGRGQHDDMISPQQHETVFNWLYDLAGQAPFDIKTTAAEHYRRVAIQRRTEEARKAQVVTAPGFQYRDNIRRASKGVNDGNGCCFISHIGDVYPSGFMPIVAGNVRQQSVTEIYRKSSLFLELRDTSRLTGKCGRCEYNHICGGSRARAYAMTGDYLAPEPNCVYQPGSPT